MFAIYLHLLSFENHFISLLLLAILEEEKIVIDSHYLLLSLPSILVKLDKDVIHQGNHVILNYFVNSQLGVLGLARSRDRNL